MARTSAVVEDMAPTAVEAGDSGRTSVRARMAQTAMEARMAQTSAAEGMTPTQSAGGCPKVRSRARRIGRGQRRRGRALRGRIGRRPGHAQGGSIGD